MAFAGGGTRVVFVGNIPYNATENDIGQMFSQCGQVVNVEIQYYSNGRPKGFAFCEFQDHQGAVNAVNNMNGAELNGVPLVVSLDE